MNVDMIVQSRARSADTANMEFTVGKRDATRAVEIVQAAQKEIGFEAVAVNEDVAKVSVIGVGMRSHAGVAQSMFQALAEKNINIQVISTSEIKIDLGPDRRGLYRTGGAGPARGLRAGSALRSCVLRGPLCGRLRMRDTA